MSVEIPAAVLIANVRAFGRSLPSDAMKAQHAEACDALSAALDAGARAGNEYVQHAATSVGFCCTRAGGDGSCIHDRARALLPPTAPERDEGPGA